MNLLRRLRAKMGLYNDFNEGSRINLENFYQFILDKKSVIEVARGMGFSLILEESFDATKGLKDEISVLRPILQRIYDSQSILFKGVRFLINILFSKIAGHMVLLIFQKKK